MMMGKVDDIAAAGVTHVWLPPPSHSVSNEGFLLFLSLPPN
jgi:alpha-amylase